MQPLAGPPNGRQGRKTTTICLILALVLSCAGIAAMFAASPPEDTDDRFDDALLELDQTLVELEHLEQRNLSTAAAEARSKVSVAVGNVRRAAGETGREGEISDIEATYADLDRTLAGLPGDATGPETAAVIEDEVRALRVAWHREYFGQLKAGVDDEQARAAIPIYSQGGSSRYD
jgi:hypothetical protein